MLELNQRKSAMEKPEYSELSQELKRSGQEFYDMLLIRTKYELK